MSCDGLGAHASTLGSSPPRKVSPTLRSDMVVLTDEAHRSQYDTLALNMPNAAFLAFTGTPLIATEERTRQVFGDYVSIYSFKQSIDDGSTVPLYYENRIPELQLTTADLNQDMEDLVEAADLKAKGLDIAPTAGACSPKAWPPSLRPQPTPSV